MGEFAYNPTRYLHQRLIPKVLYDLDVSANE